MAAGPGGLPTALFCSNDWLAIATIGALARRGLAVPGDVAVTGFDGIAVGAHLTPPLATIVQPSAEMGRQAALRLIAMLGEAEGQAGDLILPFTFRPSGPQAGPASPHSGRPREERADTM